MKKSSILPLLLSLVVLSAGCTSSEKETFADTELAYCHRQVLRTLDQLRAADGSIDHTQTPRNIPDSASEWTLRSVLTPEEWCAGFFPGILWYDYANSADTAVLSEAAAFTEPLRYLAYRPVYDHDLGFIMIGSYLQGWNSYNALYEQTRNAAYAQAAADYHAVLTAAADSLATLYNPAVGTLLSWPRNVEMFGGHNTIMDNMINLELLFWAAEHSEQRQHLYDIAVSHADTTMAYHFRPDGSSYHVAVYDPATGRHLRNCTHQGHADETMWARGQAWAIYGYTMVHHYTHEPRFLAFAQKVADIYLAQLDTTMIPYWDFSQTDYRDASAAAIVASALIELSAHADNGGCYLNAAKAMLRSLSEAPYRPGDAKPSFLRHSVGNFPAGSEIDYSINYADYYYIEALTRLKALGKQTTAQHPTRP